MPPADATTRFRPDPTSASAHEYCRDARRLRYRFRNDRAALHLSLRALADRADARRPEPAAAESRSRPGTRTVTDWPTRPVARDHRSTSVRVAVARRSFVPPPPLPAVAALSASAEAVEQFAVLVESALDEGLLRQSRRKALLRDAAGLGIEPFEATLVIAAVEHRRLATPVAPAPSPAAGTSPANPRFPRTSASVGVLVAAALFVEAAGALACWVATRV